MKDEHLPRKNDKHEGHFQKIIARRSREGGDTLFCAIRWLPGLTSLFGSAMIGSMCSD